MFVQGKKKLLCCRENKTEFKKKIKKAKVRNIYVLNVRGLCDSILTLGVICPVPVLRSENDLYQPSKYLQQEKKISI